jgi:hypothetical protein
MMKKTKGVNWPAVVILALLAVLAILEGLA